MAARGPGPIAQKIDALLRERGMTKRKLSQLADISEQAMQKWWKGQATPTVAKCVQVAKALGVPLSALIDEEEVRVRSANDEAIETYINSLWGEDLTEEECDQLRMSKEWLPHTARPMSMREVHLAAELIRSRLTVMDDPPPTSPRAKNRFQR